MNGLNSYSINYKEIRTKNKKSILTKGLTAAAVILILSILFISLFSFIGSGENSSDFIKHEIKNGESLWSIAAHYYDSNEIDLRKVIYQIKKLNNLDSSVISPGRKILIPVNNN